MTHRMHTTHNLNKQLRTLSIAVSASLLIASAGGCKAVQKHRAEKAAEREAAQIQAMQSDQSQDRTQPAAQNPPQTQPSEWIETRRPRTGEDNAPASTKQSESLDQVVMEIIDERPSSTDGSNQQASNQQASNQANQVNQVNRSSQTSRGVEPMIDLPSPKTREEESLSKAVDLYASGDLESALRELERAIAINPRFTRAYIESGDIYMELAEYDKAERQFAAAVRSEPRNFMAQYRHASVLHKLGSLEESKRAYLRALSIRPTDFDANLGLSIVQLESGLPEQAISYAQRAVRADPPSGRARMHLGNVYAAMDQHESAIVEYQQAADMLETPGTGLLLNLADSLNQLQRYAEMVGTLEQLVLIEPESVAYERLGSGYFRLRRYDDALSAFNSSVELDPNYYPGLNGIAVCELNNYLWNGKTDGGSRERAVDAMRRSLRIERQQPKIIELLRRYNQAAGSED